MLELKNIVKTYITGDIQQNALKGINIAFRENEFVSILGQSGSGKTTMLNIMGGLDRYTSGDLIINGTSTKEYTDADWDYYRNNSIGFVFQSYNLIPHQTVLANVEMALTLAGVSKKERETRAIEVLKKVGLADHIYKKPNQMSGGQMQRVAIARALVNNPDILLADEPTGALDSETSVQIMELLKEIAKDKLVIMVTHNPQLAKQYSTRIVQLLDGQIVSDSNPYTEKNNPVQKIQTQKISMSFKTALSLSFNNLKTKKARTLLTSFAGSIGIIGIALILALSTGMNTYISNIQKDTLSSYPITIDSQTIDVSNVMNVRSQVIKDQKKDTKKTRRNKIYMDYSDLKTQEKMANSVVENNLTKFKKYLDNKNSDIHDYLGQNGVVYTYNTNFSVYSYDTNHEIIDSDTDLDNKTSKQANLLSQISNQKESSNHATNFSQLMPNADGKSISTVVTNNYDMVYGNWPTKYNEVVLVLNEENTLPIQTLCQLGFITREDYEIISEQIKDNKKIDTHDFSYKKATSQTFYLVPSCDKYKENENGTFTEIEDVNSLLESAIPLKISGVIRPKKDAENADIQTSIAYTSKLTDYLISYTDNSPLIKAQESNPAVNILTGAHFDSSSDEEKAQDAKDYLQNLDISQKASFYKILMASTQNTSNMAQDENTMAQALDYWLMTNADQTMLLRIYNEYMTQTTYEDNLKEFGKISYDSPSFISIYTDRFEDKDQITDCIQNYNKKARKDEQITYTDYVALLTSSITTIINSISNILIAFVAISLIVSGIMIGIITHISVMERTKEIGILRALGASKRNISQVFNAETFIIGCCSGCIGILISLLALIPINTIIEKISGIKDLNAQLTLPYSLILICISILITMIGGWIPAKKAAKQDPVNALRSE